MKKWNLIEKILVISAIVVSFVLSYIWKDSLFGLSVTMSGVLCVVLVSRRSNWNYLIGTYNVIGYSYLAYQWGLGGDFMLNAFYFLPMQFIGLYMWTKNLEEGAIVKSRSLSNKSFIKLLILSLFAIVAYTVALKDLIAPFFNSLNLAVSFPLYDSYSLYTMDSVSTVLSVIAMWLMAKRYSQQWDLWIIVNVASIGMWTLAIINSTSDIGNAVAMILMWSMYLANALYGRYNWKKTARS